MLGETVFGIRTIKSLALEPQRKALWDARVAEVSKWRLAFGGLSTGRKRSSRQSSGSCRAGSCWLAYLTLTDASGYAVGALFAP